MDGKYTKAAIKIVWRTLAALCLFALVQLVFWGCRVPTNSNSVLYLYVSEQNEQTSREIFTAAAAAARKYGAKLVYKRLNEWQDLDKLLANEKTRENARAEDAKPAVAGNISKKISLGLVLYPSDWNATLAARLAALQQTGAKPQTNLRISVWLLSRDDLLAPEMQNRLDAISSPSATHPAKAAAKKFFSGLLQRSD